MTATQRAKPAPVLSIQRAQLLKHSKSTGEPCQYCGEDLYTFQVEYSLIKQNGKLSVYSVHGECKPKLERKLTDQPLEDRDTQLKPGDYVRWISPRSRSLQGQGIVVESRFDPIEGEEFVTVQWEKKKEEHLISRLAKVRKPKVGDQVRFHRGKDVGLVVSVNGEGPDVEYEVEWNSDVMKRRAAIEQGLDPDSVAPLTRVDVLQRVYRVTEDVQVTMEHVRKSEEQRQASYREFEQMARDWNEGKIEVRGTYVTREGEKIREVI